MTFPGRQVLHLLAADALFHYKITGKLGIKYFFLGKFCGLSEAAKFCPSFKAHFVACYPLCHVFYCTCSHIFDTRISALVKFYSSRKSYLFNTGTIALLLSRTLFSNI